MICTEISTKKIELISGLYFFAFFSEQREYGRRKKRRKRGIELVCVTCIVLSVSQVRGR